MAQKLGFKGFFAHSNISTLQAVVTRDLVRKFNNSGLHFGASVAADTGKKILNAQGKEIGFVLTDPIKLADGCLKISELLGMEGSCGIDAESRWDNRAQEHAAKFAEKLSAGNPDFMWWDMPWWKPSVHSGFPYNQFAHRFSDPTPKKSKTLIKFRAPQTYTTYTEKRKDSKGNLVINPVTKRAYIDQKIMMPSVKFKKANPGLSTPAEYLTQTAINEYAKMDVQVPLAMAFQACDVANWSKYIGQTFRDYPITVWWHYLRLFESGNARALRIFRTAGVIERLYGDAELNTFEKKVKAFQKDHKLIVDGWIGDQCVNQAEQVTGF